MTKNTSIPDEPYSIHTSGETVLLLRPEATEIRLSTIAHNLACLNRFTGSAVFPYSVAEHSVHVSRLASRMTGGDPEVALAGLMHDAHEAYLGDVSTPVKRAVHALGSDAFDRLDAPWERRVRAVFGVSWDARISEIVLCADHVACMTERHALLPASPAWPDMPEAERDDEWFVTRARRMGPRPTWRDAERLFLAECAKLGVVS